MPQAGWFTPMIASTNLERSIAFYQHLGFEVIDTDRCEPLGWARVHCRGGALMLLRAEGPMPPHERGMLFIMYTADLVQLREHLVSVGIEVGPIQYPPYAPAGECYLHDPDEWHIGLTQWGATEHEAWLERIGRPDPYDDPTIGDIT